MNKHLHMASEPQLHFVCGKGGVGKSTYSCALAEYFVQKKLRTLLAQVNAEDSHSTILQTPAISSKIQQIRQLLWAVNVTPQASLEEYLRLKIPSKHLYKLIFDNPLMRSFLQFVPSLAELNMLGKIWYHAEEKNDQGDPRFERIVIDCPATGHGLRFLSVARVTYNSVVHGGIAGEACQIANSLEDPERSGLHVVTLPEEISVNETLQLLKDVRETKVISLYKVVLNSLTKPVFDNASQKIVEQLAALPAAIVCSQLLICSQQRIDRENAEREQVKRIEKAAKDIPLIRLMNALDARVSL